jgi:hypothetical protein
MTETDKNSPPQNSSLLIPAHPLIGREENMKLLFDQVMGTATDGMRNSSDWSNSRARIDIRSERQAASLDKLLDTVTILGFQNLLVAAQTGQTENEVEQGPEDSAAGSEDTSNATVATSNAAVAASLGSLAQALIPIIAGTSGVVSVQTLAAVLASVVASAGAAASSAGAPSAKA